MKHFQGGMEGSQDEQRALEWIERQLDKKSNAKLLKRNSNREDKKIGAKKMQLLSYENYFNGEIQWNCVFTEHRRDVELTNWKKARIAVRQLPHGF